MITIVSRHSTPCFMESIFENFKCLIFAVTGNDLPFKKIIECS